MGEMKKVRKELRSRTFSAASGEVTATVNGEMDLVSIKIDPGCLRPDRGPALEGHILNAVNDALKKAKSESAKMLSGLTGLKIPGMG
jgi:nucleoid-associated protein EbfC